MKHCFAAYVVEAAGIFWLLFGSGMGVGFVAGLLMGETVRIKVKKTLTEPKR
jgi:hypothetical protein